MSSCTYHCVVVIYYSIISRLSSSSFMTTTRPIEKSRFFFLLLDTSGDHIILLLQSSTTPRVNEFKHFYGEIDFIFSGTSVALDTSHSTLSGVLIWIIAIRASNGWKLKARVYINILFIVNIGLSRQRPSPLFTLSKNKRHRNYYLVGI